MCKQSGMTAKICPDPRIPPRLCLVFSMAHLAPNTVIFSPSVARAAATAAKDWNFVDGWLASQFHGRAPPAFERNADTLRALLALASANDAADESRACVARAEAAALRELEAQDAARGRQPAPPASQRASGAQRPDAGVAAAGAAILGAVEEGLSREGRDALEAMASAAVEAGIMDPTPESLGRCMLDLQARAQELDVMTTRVAALQRFVDEEASQVQRLVDTLHSENFRPAPDLAKQNLEMQRRARAMAAALPGSKEKAAPPLASTVPPTATIESVSQQEEEYLALLALKKDLAAQLDAFGGLSHDPVLARADLDKLRAELQQATRRRDAVFEGLVERETPRKAMR